MDFLDGQVETFEPAHGGDLSMPSFKLPAGDGAAPPTSELKPFLKWPGGKEGELPALRPYFPADIDRYIEPFLGGGAAYYAATAKRYAVNDRSEDLMALYGYIQAGDAAFFEALEAVSELWDGTRLSRSIDTAQLVALTGQQAEVLDWISRPWTGRLSAAGLPALDDRNGFARAVLHGLKRKMKAVTSGAEAEGATIALETAMKAAIYGVLRDVYNQRRASGQMDAVRAVAFFFMREFCYSSMFRFSGKGEFNVPFGGHSYGRKSLAPKIRRMRSPELSGRFAQTEFHCGDFERFMAAVQPQASDFIFLDPPYDSAFSTYDNNEFGVSDQARLARALKATPARFMLVVKNTPLMQELYDDGRLLLLTYDMKYSVSFMNRNDRNVEHLMVLNYAPPGLGSLN